MEDKAAKVVKIHDVRIDQEYTQWLGEIKARYRNAQIKAAVRVNAEQLLFNWELGRDLVMRKAEEKWGAGVVEQISLDLQAAFPESRGFSARNLWNMKKWYTFYAGNKDRLSLLLKCLQSTDSKDDIKLHQVGAELPGLFALVPWRHHIEIITGCKTIEEALFYLTQTASAGWSRNTLMNCIKADLYHTSGGAYSNFTENLSSSQSELAQAITKDTYDFGFLSLAEGYKEEALETELEKHLARFLLELGTGFAYLGRQKQVIVAGKTRKIDMLFFHIPLNCYIVVELKAVPFQPEFAGKLNYYVNIVDDLIRTSAQNPTIGLLICADKDNTEVQYTIKGIQTPIGVASYDNVKIKEIQDQLPSIEELKRRIQLLGDD